MEAHNRLTSHNFERQFETCIMHPHVFTHEAHLRLAYIHIAKYGLSTAIRNVPAQIKRYATSLGDAQKFNLTVSIAAVHAVAHFMQKSVADNFYDFIREFPRLKTHFKQLLEHHYGFDIFSSNEARDRYLEPDLVPFD